MRTMKFTIVAMITAILVSCGGGSKQSASADGFGALEKKVKSKFGDKAFFTDLKIIHIDGIGNLVSTIVTEDPESLKMEEWNLSQNKWKQTSEITLEVPEGTKAADYMYQLGDEINLSKLGELVETSKEHLEKEKGLKKPAFENAFVKFPKNGDMSKAEYAVSLKPENGGTTFSFYYKLNGELIEMDY